MFKYIISFFLILTSCIHPVESTIQTPGREKETTFFQTCWGVLSQQPKFERAIYPSVGFQPCQTPEDIIWENLPIRVRIDDNLPNDDKKAIRHAMNYWDIVAGRDIFIEVSASSDLDIIMMTQNSWSGAILAATFHLRDEGKLLSKILVYPLTYNDDNENRIVDVYLHELSHVIALDHDENLPSSLMYPFIGDGTQEITITDQMAIIERYGTKPTLSKLMLAKDTQACYN